MLGTLMALCILHAQKIDLDGEAAVARAQRLLKQLGVHENLPLQSLSDRSYLLPEEPCWSVWLKAERGPIEVVLDAHTGHVLLIQARPDLAIQNASNQPPTPESTQRAKTLLHLLGYDHNVTLSTRIGFASGPSGAIFYRTLHGLTFFNLNPTYGHRLVFEPQTGAINYFLPSPPLPEVNAWKPKVSGPVAMEKMRLWVEKRAKERHKALRPYQVGKWKPELGYWKFKGEALARLVWQSASSSEIKGKPYGLGVYRILVDALTGELIEPDDPAIGANP